jgi:hypothetical protein
VPAGERYSFTVQPSDWDAQIAVTVEEGYGSAISEQGPGGAENVVIDNLGGATPFTAYFQVSAAPDEDAGAYVVDGAPLGGGPSNPSECLDDPAEEDDTQNEARPLLAGSHSHFDRVICPGDADVVRVTLKPDESYELEVDPTDWDAAIYMTDDAGHSGSGDARGAGGDESVVARNTGNEPINVWFEVRGATAADWGSYERRRLRGWRRDRDSPACRSHGRCAASGSYAIDARET